MHEKHFVLEITFDKYEIDYIIRDVEILHLEEWALEHDFELFFTYKNGVISGIAFRGTKMPCYTIDSSYNVSIILDGDNWDTMVPPESIELRIL